MVHSSEVADQTFYAKIHNVVPADGTVINHNIPGPEGDCIPLFHFKVLRAHAAVGATRGIHIHRCHHFGNTKIMFLYDMVQLMRNCWSSFNFKEE